MSRGTPSPSQLAYWVTPRRDRIEQAARRQMLRACYSHLNWHAETRAAIEMLAVAAGRDALSRWEVVAQRGHEARLELRVHARGRLPPASLTYLMHANGSITLVVRAHDATRHLLDHIDHADALAGAGGHARVRRQLEALRRISCDSMETARPSTASARFLRRLQRRTRRFARLPQCAEAWRITGL